MKKTTKINKVNSLQEWKENRPLFLLFIVVILIFIFILLWTKLMISRVAGEKAGNQAVTEKINLVEQAVSKVEEIGKNVSQETPGIRITNRVAQESKFLALSEAQKNFDDFSFITSPNGESIAYTILDKKTNKRSVVLNGKAGASYDDITFMKFSDNGQRFAYGAKINGKSLVVLDGREGKLYDWVFEPHFFLPDNQYFVYKARNDRGDILVFNTWESQPYERIYSVIINKDQSELIFYARKDNNLWRALVSLNK